VGRRRKGEHRRKQAALEDLVRAEASLAEASRLHAQQEALRVHEKNTVVRRLERLTAGNHLAEKLLEAFTERYS
jgi:hypothetical protein